MFGGQLKCMQFVQTFVALCANALDVQVKCLHSDGECKGHKDLDAMCAQAGIIQEFSTTETPQLNGEAERLMRTIVEAARALCYGGNVPAHLWEHAIQYYVYMHNLTPRVVLDGKTPWEFFTKRTSPSLPKFYFGEHVACYVDEKQRQTKAAKQVDPLGKMQLPWREARYLGPTTDPLTYSFPGGHRVWETAEGQSEPVRYTGGYQFAWDAKYS